MHWMTLLTKALRDELTKVPHLLYPRREVLNVVEKLRDYKIGASINFRLEILKLRVFV